MKKDFDTLLETLSRFEGFSSVDTSLDPLWVQFRIGTEALKIISAYADAMNCRLISMMNPDDVDDITHQLIFEGEEKEVRKTVRSLNRKLVNYLQKGESKRHKHQELGIPDLSLVTIRQMANELKLRQNLTFAVVWIESNERDNIAIEGSGNPTQLVGLLARGLHMAIEWADKNIKFYRPRDEEG